MRTKGKCLLAAGVLSLCIGVAPVYAGTWVPSNDNWNYLDDSGNQVKNQWVLDQGNWYFVSTEGTLLRGWRKMSSATYYFDESSGALAKGWKENPDGQTFYYTEEGTMKTGWLQDGGHYYWFDEQGHMIKNTWKTIDGQKYYFNADGTMAANQYVGLSYMDENGKVDESKKFRLEVNGNLAESEEKEITEILERIPKVWMEDFVNRGFKIVLEKKKTYLSKKTLEDKSVYYRHHSLDVGSRRIRATDADGVFRGICEYIGYYSGALKEGSAFLYDWGFYLDELRELFDFPEDFDDEERMYFGEALCWYLDTSNTKRQLTNAAPNLVEDLEVALDPSKEQEMKAEDRPDGPYKQSLLNKGQKGTGPASQS
ncbi:MAG: hypothetical protein Q4D90_09010 [bacterium]|nr:hypothetical protein [bacterium]